MFLLEKYFYVNDVNVKVNNLNNDNDSAYEIRIKAVSVKENIGYTVGYLVRTVNSKYKHALPTLGMAGWVTDLAPAADFLFSYYFTTFTFYHLYFSV